MRELRVAESAGFCFGVRRSVEMAEKLLAEESSLVSLGDLIHNRDVVGALQEKGLRVASAPEEVPFGATVILRAHGVSRDMIRLLEQRQVRIIDGTCPKVKAIHAIVSRASEEGRFVLIIGMKHHPEVEAVRGWCEDSEVFENPHELELWLEDRPDFWKKPITVVVQTTQTRSNFNECCEIIKKRCTNAKISDTICLATFTRQKTQRQQCSSGPDLPGRVRKRSIY